MSIIFPALMGIIIKLYDDIEDFKINVSPVFMESIKSLMIAITVLTIQTDFYLAFPCFVFSLLNSGFDTPFWKSLIPVSGLLSVITFPYAEDGLFYNILLTLLVVGGIAMGAMVEDKMFSEEVSIEKWTSRGLILLGLGAMLVVPYMDWFMIPEFSRNAMYQSTVIVFFYVLCSLATMGYQLVFSKKTLQELNPGRAIQQDK
jgi:peptidoglycan/LPS O-acetylase OafA/YrhL